MPTKKAKTKSSKKKAAAKKAAKKKAVPKKKSAVKRSAAAKAKVVASRTAATKKSAVKTKAKPATKKTAASRSRGPVESAELLPTPRRGLGADWGGQSGDEQGLSDVAETDSESVVELLEEGQAYEAEAVRGVENAPDADVSEVRTHEVPEDDVPEEYRKQD